MTKIEQALGKSMYQRPHYPTSMSANARHLLRKARETHEDAITDSQAAVQAWKRGHPIKARDFSPKPWDAGWIDVTDEPMADVIALVECGQIFCTKVGERWLARST